MGFRIVLVEPEYEINLGYCARVMKNFGFDELYIVNPKCEVGFEAKMYAKHGAEILKNAKICRSLKEATRGCYFSIGTTGILRRHRKTLRNPLTLREFRKRKKELRGKIAIIFGREGIGLNEKEISECDFLLTIPANPNYPVLNISHALAIFLYELSGLKPRTIERASPRLKEEVVRGFERIVEMQKDGLRNPKKIKVAFRRVIGRSLISEVEANAIAGVFRKIIKRGS